MRFTAEASDDSSSAGEVTNYRGDPSRAFCDLYRSLASSIFDSGTLRLEPCFWGEGAEPDADLPAARLAFSQEDEQPELFQAVFECLGYDPSENDVLVMIQDSMLELPLTSTTMLPVVIQDAASILTDFAGLPQGIADDLGWMASDLLRAGLAAVMTRATEHLLGDPPIIEAAYAEICACASANLIEARYNRWNGEVIFARQNPGIVSLLADLVETIRRAPPLSLPLNADAVQRQALDVLEASLAVLRPILKAA